MQSVLYILPFLVLGYYLWSNWSYIKNQPIILGFLIVGTLLWFSGIAVYENNPPYASLAKFSGIVIILIGIAIDAFKRFKNPDKQ